MNDRERITRLEIRCEQLQLTVNEAFHWIDILKSDLSDLQDRVGQADRKTEPTISKMEQVETMSCAECKHRPIGAEICEEPCHYEPQTDWHYDEQDATWYPYKHEDEPQIKGSKRLLKGKDEQSGKE